MSYEDRNNDIYIVPESLKNKTTAVIYIRVSTKRQVQGTGLERQREACMAFAQRAGLTVMAIREDAGISGALYKARPALQAALTDLEEGKAEVLIVEDFGRLSQDQENSKIIINRVERAGAVLILSEAQRVGSPAYNFEQQTRQMLMEHRQAVRKEAFHRGARMGTAKAEVESLLHNLPDDCSVEDVQYHLYVMEKVRHGLEAADRGGAIMQNEAEEQLGKWIIR